MKKSMLKIKSQLGLSVIELLVAMTIGLIILAGVITFMGDSKSQYLMEQEISYIQENIRFASDQISHDIRMAGYLGCHKDGEITNTLTGSTTATNWHLSSNGIVGFEIGDANYPAQYSADVLAGTDTFIVNWGEPDDSIQVASHTAASATFNMVSPTGIPQGSVLVVASPSCKNMAIFQMTGPSNSSVSAQLNHSQGGVVSPGNCRKALSDGSGNGYACDSAPGASVAGVAYGPGSSLMRFHSNAFFVKNSPRTGLPSLFRQSLSVSGGSVSTQAQELVSGVEDMEVIYGVDSDAVADGIVNRYYSADQITTDVATGATGWVGWDRVIVARVTLIVRSTRQVYFENTTVDLGDGDTFNDRYMRQKASFTVQIRNRGLGT